MPDWVAVVLAVLGARVLVWVALIVALVAQHRRLGRELDWREILRLIPDVVRLVRRLAADPSVPWGTRIWLGALLVYLLLPIDLVPDFLPVIGVLDDALIAALVLRYVIRHAGRDAVARHWPGTTAGLEGMLALIGLGASDG